MCTMLKVVFCLHKFIAAAAVDVTATAAVAHLRLGLGWAEQTSLLT